MLLLLFLPQLCLSLEVTIDNTRARTDVTGQLMDVHDGTIIRWEEGGLFHWYGMGYKDCELEEGLIPPYNCPGIYQPFGHCGFRNDHSVNLYTSPDLQQWTFAGDIFPEGVRPEGIYFRPKVIYNSITAEYVLWINYLAPALSPLISYPDARLSVATSPSPTGPFTLVTEKAAIEVSGGGDFTLLIDPNDDNGTAYIAYDAWGNNHALVVEQLTWDYKDSFGSTASSGTISPISNEAPLFFERNGWYYLLYGHTCCFCAGGSGAEVWAASHPLGPWENLNLDINPRPNILSPHTIPAQPNYVIKLEQDDGETQYLYTGDLWSSAPDSLKSHDLQYWSPPLQFDDTFSPPRIAVMDFVANFTLTISEQKISLH